MLKDVQNSIKAKLYDFTYSPFMSSMIISWIIINHKYILIYMSSAKLESKLKLLTDYDFSLHTPLFDIPWAMNVWLPIGFGLFYTFLYPIASKKFYEHTLEKNKELKKIKQEIEDVTPITQEEARTLRESITTLTDHKYELEKKLIDSEDRFKNKVEEKKKYIIPRAIKTDNRNTNETKVVEVTEPQEDDKTKFLRYLYESNYKPMSESKLLDSIVNHTVMARPKAKKIFDELMDKKILEFVMIKSYERVGISDNGNHQLLEMFDEDK